MALPVLLFSTVGAAALALVCARKWHTALVLALIEVAWIALCGVYAAQLLVTGDLFFLLWACLMLFFSAVELVLSAVLFAQQVNFAGTPTAHPTTPTRAL